MNRGQKIIILALLAATFLLFKDQIFNSKNIFSPEKFNSKIIFSPENSQYGQELIKLIFPPSEMAYNLNGIEKTIRPDYDYKVEHSVTDIVLKLLNGKKGGFFIEAGANDGEFLSNTLKLEMEHQWSGILVESDPVPLKLLFEKGRKAFIANICLAANNFPEYVKMYRPKHIAMSSNVAPDFKEEVEEFQARCFPIRDLLNVLGISQIDYFSLDIEGAEMGVLKNYPWDEIQIKVLSIEVNKLNKTELEILMNSKGFKLVQELKGYYIEDYIYAHNSLFN